jgi:hypothetical protein
MFCWPWSTDLHRRKGGARGPVLRARHQQIESVFAVIGRQSLSRHGLGPLPTTPIYKRWKTPQGFTRHLTSFHWKPHQRSLRALEGSEARARPQGQCRWRPEGLLYPKKTLKEHISYTDPDVTLAIDLAIEFVAPTRSSTDKMDAASAGIRFTSYLFTSVSTYTRCDPL